MIELPDFTVRGTEDTLAGLKVHQLARTGRTLVFGSFVGAGNAVKVVRAGLYSGMNCWCDEQQIVFPKPKDETPWAFRQVYLGKGYVHCTLLWRTDDILVALNGTDDEWLGELLRLSTAPVLPEFVPYLKARIRSGSRSVQLSCFNLDAEVYRVDDEAIGRLLIEGVEAGELEIPECACDLGELGGLPAYIRAYAPRMVESAGSSLSPLFHPERDAVRMPALGRKPFTPQAWLIEAGRRAMSV